MGQPGEVYNLASGVETSILDLATLINQSTRNPAPLDFRPRREWDRSGKRFGSTEKAKRALGFEAHVALYEGLRRTIDWTQEHLPLIDRCVQKHADRIRLG
jgi:nucleoside-diphosphate-sugar epimerase